MSDSSASARSDDMNHQHEKGNTEPLPEFEAQIDVTPEDFENPVQTGVDPEDSGSALETELADVKDRLLRLQAEFDNYRKRMDRERIEIRRRAAEDLVSELLPVLDHFEMGLESLQTAFPDDPTADGIKLVFKQLLQALKQAGLEEVPAEGNSFDPNVHEAVGNLPTQELEEGTVAQQIRKGYLLNRHLLRPASVLVACPIPEDEPSES
jgi:molecular chaperone GrpE